MVQETIPKTCGQRLREMIVLYRTEKQNSDMFWNLKTNGI